MTEIRFIKLWTYNMFLLLCCGLSSHVRCIDILFLCGKCTYMFTFCLPWWITVLKCYQIRSVWRTTTAMIKFIHTWRWVINWPMNGNKTGLITEYECVVIWSTLDVHSIVDLQKCTCKKRYEETISTNTQGKSLIKGMVHPKKKDLLKMILFLHQNRFG